MTFPAPNLYPDGDPLPGGLLYPGSTILPGTGTDGAVYPGGGTVAPPTGTPDLPVLPSLRELEIAHLGFTSSQRFFVGSTEKVYAGACGWHGRSFDNERGAVAVVRTDGPFADLVGERLRLTHFHDPAVPRSLTVYVHNEGPTVEDLSLPRMMFVRLAPLHSNFVNVSVEVLA